MANIGMAYRAMAHIVMDYAVKAYIYVTYVVIAYVVMTYVVMAYRCRCDLFGNGCGRPRARPRLDRCHSLQTLLHADASQRHVVAVSSV